MKTFNKILGITLLAFIVLSLPKKSLAQEVSITYQDFYDNLQPYGTWVYNPQYGNVWVPDAEEGFRPYASRGHWVETDYGTTWVSDYRWGWAPFHYGRWRYDDYYGWEWVPGYEWAPAWVSWRHGGGYYGWAPLTVGISVTVAIGGGYHVPDNYWVCAPERYINRPNIYNYYVPHTRVVNIIHNTTIINNTYVNNNRTYIVGPRPQEIRQVTHVNVQIYHINNISRPGVTRVSNQTINIYRPAVQQAANAHPARVIDASAYRQQHPNNSVAARGAGGATAFNHSNAQQLAMVARAPHPDNRVVRVNPVNNTRAIAAPAVNRQQQQAAGRQPASASPQQQRS